MKALLIPLSCILFNHSLYASEAIEDSAPRCNIPADEQTWQSSLAKKFGTGESNFGASFEALYEDSNAPKWAWIVGGAMIGTAAVLVTGGSATPIITSIGTAVGTNILGLSGAAATNAGLALLGGGSIASGGFGIAGGTALLSGVLSFSTEVSVSYAVDRLNYDEFDYSRLVQASEVLTPLPLPNDNDLTPTYQMASSILSEIPKDLPISDPTTQEKINRAICKILESYILPKPAPGFFDRVVGLLPADSIADIVIKDQIVLSILHFLVNDYDTAKKYSALALQSLEEAGSVRTVPQFLAGVSSIYEERFDMDVLQRAYFAPAFLKEPTNKMIPTLLAILLDRMLLRIEDGQVSIGDLKQLRSLIDSEELRDFQKVNYSILMSRYLILLKYCQQQVSTLTRTESKILRSSPLTRLEAERRINEYKSILQDALPIYEYLSTAGIEFEDIVKSWPEYTADLHRLQNLVAQYDGV